MSPVNKKVKKDPNAEKIKEMQHQVMAIEKQMDMVKEENKVMRSMLETTSREIESIKNGVSGRY